MRTTKTLTVSLPPAMLSQFEQIRIAENRTRSELMREALRKYFDTKWPVYTPTKSELAAIKRGRAEFKKGNYITLDQLIHDLDNKRYQAGKPGFRKPAR